MSTNIVGTHTYITAQEFYGFSDAVKYGLLAAQAMAHTNMRQAGDGYHTIAHPTSLIAFLHEILFADYNGSVYNLLAASTAPSPGVNVSTVHLRLMTPEQYVAFVVAVWFHDIVYTPGAKDNEAQSMEQAKEWLNNKFNDYFAGLGMAEDAFVALVLQYILITKVTTPYRDILSVPHGDLMHDLDFWGFRSNRVMECNRQLLLKEAILAGMTEREFYVAQLEFMWWLEKNILCNGGGRLFLTPEYSDNNLRLLQRLWEEDCLCVKELRRLDGDRTDYNWILQWFKQQLPEDFPAKAIVQVIENMLTSAYANSYLAGHVDKFDYQTTNAELSALFEDLHYLADTRQMFFRWLMRCLRRAVDPTIKEYEQ